MKRLQIIFTLAGAFILPACGGAVEKAGVKNTNDAAPLSINAASPAPSADNAASVAPATGATVAATTPTTSGGAGQQPGATPKDGARSNSNAQQATMPKPRIGSGGNDFSLFTQARGAINSDAELSAANITVEVKDGVVTLGGAVTSAAQKSRAEQLVLAGGAKSVKNQIKVAGGK